jgi:biotin carboxylase
MTTLSQPTLLVLAAGPLQIPALTGAREMGIRTIALDGNPDAAGFPLADAHYVVDIRSHSAVEQIARKERINGIMTLCTDMPVRVVASVGQSLGLPTLTSEAAANATDKRLMRRAFVARNAPSVHFNEVDDFDAAVLAAKRIGYPVAIKVPCSSGSRGVFQAGNDAELHIGFCAARRYEAVQGLLIEEWIQGPELSVEGMCHHGDITIVQLTDKCVFSGPFPVESGHTQPSTLAPAAQNAIREATVSGVQALGLDNCAFHAELKFSNRGPRIIEIGARLGGDRISTHLTPLSTGIDLVRASIQIAVGRSPELTGTWNRGSAIRYFHAPRLGRLKAVSGLDDVSKRPGLEFLFPASERDGPLGVGFEIKSIHSSLDRYGHVIFSGADAHEAACRAEDAAQSMRFIYEDDDCTSTRTGLA